MSRIKRIQVLELKQSNSTISAEQILQALKDGAEIALHNCRISGVLDMKDWDEDSDASSGTSESVPKKIRILQPIRFNACTFEADVVFCGPWESPDSIQVVFENDVVFNSSVFCSQARFSYSEFHGLAGFDGCTFNRVCAFRRTRFLGRAMFRTVTYEGYALFNDARFQGDTRFTNTCYCRGANFLNVCFDARPDFSGVYSRSRSIPLYDNIRFARKRYGDDESFWRFIKQACQEAGHYQQAGECFYLERCANFRQRLCGRNYEKLSPLQRLIRWCLGMRLLPEYVFGRLLFGYGERPIRVLIAGVVVIVLCGIFYGSSVAHLGFQYGLENAHSSDHLRWMEGMYYSTVTFTTLGYGDIYPAADTLTRSVVMFESIAGACLMALFVVSLAKRYSRG